MENYVGVNIVNTVNTLYFQFNSGIFLLILESEASNFTTVLMRKAYIDNIISTGLNSRVNLESVADKPNLVVRFLGNTKCEVF